jgi:AhpD family alkylhydroperoxidase
MTPRFMPIKIAPDLIKSLLDLENRLAAGGLERSLTELVKLRASQINGCAYCIHMRATEARSPVKKEFSEAELVNLTVMIGAINLWNRLQIAARAAHPINAAA